MFRKLALLILTCASGFAGDGGKALGADPIERYYRSLEILPRVIALVEEKVRSVPVPTNFPLPWIVDIALPDPLENLEREEGNTAVPFNSALHFVSYGGLAAFFTFTSGNHKFAVQILHPPRIIFDLRTKIPAKNFFSWCFAPLLFRPAE